MKEIGPLQLDLFSHRPSKKKKHQPFKAVVNSFIEGEHVKTIVHEAADVRVVEEFIRSHPHLEAYLEFHEAEL